MKEKEKALSVLAGLIILSSAAIVSGDEAIYELKTQPEQRVGVIKTEEFNSEIFQVLVAKSGVILTKGSLSTMLGPAISAEGFDAVTAPSMMPFP